MGVVHERSRELESLLHPAGERVGAVVPAFGEPELVEHDAGPLGRVVAGKAVQPPEVDDLLAGRHRRIETSLLRHVAPAAAILPAHLPPAEADLAAVGREHCEQDAEQCRLAGAVRTEEPGEHARCDVERDAVERDPTAERVRDVTDLELHPLDARRGVGSAVESAARDLGGELRHLGR